MSNTDNDISDAQEFIQINAFTWITALVASNKVIWDQGNILKWFVDSNQTADSKFFPNKNMSQRLMHFKITKRYKKLQN